MRFRLLLAVAAAFSLIILLRPVSEEKTGSRPVSGGDEKTAAPTRLASEEAKPAEKTSTAVSDDPMGDFTEWTWRYLDRPNPALISEGVKLARERRPVFKTLIKENPKAALEQAVPMVVRQKLPPEIVAHLESRVNGVGALRVYQGAPLPGEEAQGSLTQRVAEMKGGKTYDAHVYGRRAESVAWVPGASLNGVAVDEAFAVNEMPSRTLEVGETPPADKPPVVDCPVSGRQVLEEADAITEVITEDTPAIETATETVYFCSDVHINTYNQTLIMGEGVTGGAFGYTGILPAAPTPSMGVVKVLIIPMTFADQNGVPATETTLYNMLRDVSEFYSKSSYGRLSLVGVVTPPVKLPHNEAWYVNRDTSNGGDIDGEGVEHAHAREEARKLGFDSNDYDCVGVRHTGGPGSYGGLGGGSSVWARSDSSSLWAHEIGHCFALAHANFWDTAGTSSIGNGTNNEYGDSYDNMGSGPYPGGQYNAQAKAQIRWLPQNALQPVTESGVYRIHAMDGGLLDPTRRYALNIVKDSQKTYWGEVRSLQDSNPWIKNGLILGWRYPSGSGSNIQLIDTTPGSPFLKEDAPISLGSTFSDSESGIHLTTVAANDNPRYMDVRVNLGTFETNQRPTLSLAASAEVVPQNATVTFTATATDPDGDALAYAWQHFGDSTFKTVSPNAAVITRTFTSAGTYVVTCTVSDMKGGTATRNQLITVGSGNSRSTISGRVTLLGQGLQDVVVTANGANGVVTDADGYFTIPNLAANTYSLTPLLYGYTFGELFNNSITVGPNFSGANFEAAAQSLVTITALTPDADELAPVTPGAFRISRTGDTSQDLVVNVNAASGTATITTDYTLSPAYATGAQGFSTFTIPAGSADLDVILTPAVDTAAEGPETAVLQLGPGNGYLVAMPSKATVVIADDDTTLPKVAITATRNSALENLADPAVFTLSRTGSTAAALTVDYAVSGSAASGADFTPLSGSVTIPAGAASAPVNVTMVDDSTSESLETVKLTLSTNAAHLIDPTQTSATANLYDDDTQVVNVTATDAAATEVDLSVPGAPADTGTFVISRSGDTTAPLTVYYAFAGVHNTGIQALHGVDFENMPGHVIIPAGETQASITILPRFDGLGEGAEQVVLYIGASATNYIVGSSGSAMVTISDNAADLPYVNVVNTGSANEGGTAVFRITVRGGTGTGTLSVPYEFSGTASAGDFTVSGTGNTLTGTTITLNNGATVTKDVTITNVQDGELEDLESLTLTLVPGGFTTYAPTASATMWLRDNDNVNTVYVDTQVGTSTSYTMTEGATTSPVKFYVSRTGSTASALTVNYTLGGTATSVDDYAALGGSVVIPAGSLGVDVPVSVVNDTLFEGTETIIFSFAAGAYSRSPGTATMYIADNDTATATVAFDQPGSYGSESITSVSIPVSLSAAQAAPVTVDYTLNTSTSGSSSSVSAHPLPIWVRLVKTGNTLQHFESTDGVIWTQRGSNANVPNLGSTSYLAGIAVCSGSTTATTATIDNFTITGLSAGGSTGTATVANIGNAGPSGTHSLAGGVYSFSTPGSGLNTNDATDDCRFVHLPVSNSADCTVTARLTGIASTSSSARYGVMLRSSTAQGSVHAASLINGSTSRNFYPLQRLTTSAASTNPTTFTTQIMPMWYRLARSGDVFSTSFSPNGAAWTTVGSSRTLALGPKVLAGLAVSAQSDGLIATATFDNVTLNGAPVTALAGRTVGFVNEQGTDSHSSGVWTLTGSGAGISNNSDEAHFAALEVTGDFTLIGRVTSLTGGNNAAQAGLMARQTRDHYSRMIHTGFVKSGSSEHRYRINSATNAFGSGVDFSLANGTLTFAPGETKKNIALAIIDDDMDEPDNVISIQLVNAFGANVGANAWHGYTILDDDDAPTSPYVGFAAATSTVSEGAGAAGIPLSLSAAATSITAIDYAVTGGTATGGGVDFTLASGTLSFPAGSTVQNIPLSIIDDTLLDANETLIVTLSNPAGLQTGSITSHTVTITDNDLPVVTIIANDPTAAEAGLDPGQFTISRTGDTAASLAVSLTRSGTATNGTDHTSIATTQTLPAGASSVTVNVTPLADTTNEGTETVILTLAANAAYAIGTPNSATVSILDDDRSTVTLVANDPTASESGNTGQFTLTRTAPTTGSLTVNLTRSGTATNTTDYANIASTESFAAGQSTRTINVTPVDDAITEGDEQVTLSLASGSYDIGVPFFDNVTITDNDNPPVVFINSPSAQGPLIANGNGVILSATITDDGAPAAVAQTWTQVSGPAAAAIESPTAATTAVTFTTPGTYMFRVTATDTQFTVSDQVTVVAGNGLVAADWITQDLTPSSQRRGQGIEFGGQFTVTGAGAGYASQTNDGAHVMVRQISGDGSLVARLTSLPVSTALSGLTIRDSMARGARRAVLGYVPGTGLQFRARTTVSTNDTLIASQTGLTLPLWLKLERNAATNEISASYGGDGATWTPLGGTTVITMGSAAQFGLTTTNNSTAGTATSVFDNVSLTPAPSGPALLSEDSGASPAAAGSGSFDGTTHTIIGSTTGYYHGSQYFGDMVVTTRLVTFSSGAGSAIGGLRVAESMESAAYAHLGRIPTGSYSGYLWTSVAGGSGGGVPSGIAAGNWIKIVRKGNSITGYRATHNITTGGPNAWTQIGQPQTVIMTTPVFVGFFVNNASGVGLNTCTFTHFTVDALNKAPIVAATAGSVSPVALDGTVTDDDLPAAPTSLWTVRSGPPGITFANASLPDTTATLTDSGAFALRLTADDTATKSFFDLDFFAYATPFAQWLDQTGAGDMNNQAAEAMLDADGDGILNLMEYAIGTNGVIRNASPQIVELAPVSSEQYLRLSIPKNPAATDVAIIVEACGDLESWSSEGLVIETNTASQLVVRDAVPAGPGVKRFMRVRVVRQ